jgi:DNA-binding MarR family transcriptional regulator
VTQLLDRMTSGGLLMRRQDGRANRLYLTESGRALFNLAVPRQEDEIADLFLVLTAAERGQLSALLRKLDRALVAGDAAGGAPPCGEAATAPASPACPA